MQARFAGSFCSLVLAWLCALGATSARHATVAPATARGAVEIVLREAAGAPQLASRVVVGIGTTRMPCERRASHLAAPALVLARLGDHETAAPRLALRLRPAAHRWSRWRAYDAVAPPSGSQPRPIARGA